MEWGKGKRGEWLVHKGLSDGQTRSLRAMNIEKEVEMAIFVLLRAT